MSPTVWGAVLGALAAAGLLLVAARVRAVRRPALADRVLPYVRDLSPEPATGAPVASTRAAAVGIFGPSLRSAADLVEKVLGGAPSVRRRLVRADLDLTLHEFRIQQVQWGLVGFAICAALGLWRSVTAGAHPVLVLVLCLFGFVMGVLLRENRLTSQVTARERAVVAEFPTVAELLALAVAAGEGPVAALDRVVSRSGGVLSNDLARVLAEIRTGEPVAEAFDRWANRSGVTVVSRFAQGVAVAVERGTPLADVLHAQAADVREAGRRDLIEAAARREVVMMVPVVFLVLPVTVVFAFYPGVLGLSLAAP